MHNFHCCGWCCCCCLSSSSIKFLFLRERKRERIGIVSFNLEMGWVSLILKYTVCVVCVYRALATLKCESHVCWMESVMTLEWGRRSNVDINFHDEAFCEHTHTYNTHLYIARDMTFAKQTINLLHQFGLQNGGLLFHKTILPSHRPPYSCKNYVNQMLTHSLAVILYDILCYQEKFQRDIYRSRTLANVFSPSFDKLAKSREWKMISSLAMGSDSV